MLMFVRKTNCNLQNQLLIITHLQINNYTLFAKLAVVSHLLKAKQDRLLERSANDNSQQTAAIFFAPCRRGLPQPSIWVGLNILHKNTGSRSSIKRE